LPNISTSLDVIADKLLAISTILVYTELFNAIKLILLVNKLFKSVAAVATFALANTVFKYILVTSKAS